MNAYDETIAVLIPSLNPDDNLPQLVKSLRRQCSNPIILVNDGSREDCLHIFSNLAADVQNVTVLQHAVNLGKGRACKTGFNYYLNEFPSGTGVVTCDADGQHTPDDVVAAMQKLSQSPESLVLGCRNFSEKNVPWKSSFGNKITKCVFALFARKFVSDTQTGLRGIPAAFMKKLMNISGERFEFETHMLLEGAASKIDFCEYPIETVYINSNRATHFHPVRDSLKIYATIFKYAFKTFLLFICSSLFCATIDVALFYLFFHTFFFGLSSKWQLGLALCCSRGISLFVNYLLNRNGVFKNQSVSKKKSFPKYILLCMSVLFMAYVLNRIGQKLLPEVEPTIIKALADAMLFIFSFFVQKTLIFHNKKEQTT